MEQLADLLSLEDTLSLLSAMQELSRMRELQDITRVVRVAARKLTGTDGITFVLREGNLVYYADEDAIGPLWKGQRFPAERCISGWCMIHCQQVVIEDVFADSRIPVEAYEPTFVKSLAMVPIREQDPLGAIGGYWSNYHRASKRELVVLQLLANASAIALANVELYGDLQASLERERAARAEVEAQRARLCDLLGQLPAAINFFRGPDLICEFAHPLTLRALGKDTLAGMPLHRVLPPDGNGVEPTVDLLAQVYQTGQRREGIQLVPSACEHDSQSARHLEPGTATRDTYWNYVYLPTRSAAGDIDGVMAFSVDITDQVLALRAAEAARAHLQEIEERLRIALEASALGTWDYKPIADTLEWDRRCKELFGLPEDATVTYDDFLAMMHPADRDKMAASVANAEQLLCGGRYVFEYRTNAETMGQELWLRCNGQAYADASGQCVRMIGTVQDITAHKRAEAERAELLAREQHARAQAENASRAKDEFLAMLGHELRNPLSPIITVLELMKLRGERNTREYEIIERQARHLVRLVDDLLDVSRITRGKVILQKQPVELHKAASDAIEIASPLIEQRHHHLSVSVPTHGCAVHADPVRLAQVLANLLTNAAKYTPPGGRISLSARSVDALVEIRVRDTGQGISPELLPRVFDLFVQGARTPDRKEGGLGIGLTLVKNLVALHGGTVTAYSDGPGKGCEMMVRLPALAQDRPQTAEQALVSGAASNSCTKSRHVLVVDDNIDAADMLAESLRAVGHDVVVAHDSVTALQILSCARPAVALLDIGLPVMDGYELARRIREQLGPDAPRLIAVTGYGQEHDRERCARAGFAAHLVKPADIRKILELIEHL